MSDRIGSHLGGFRFDAACETRQYPCRPRQGFTLIEVVVAAGIIGVLFLVTIPLLGHVRTVRQEADRRMIALEEATNVMESVAVLSMRHKLDRGTLDELTLSPAADRLPQRSLTLTLDDNAEPLTGQRVTVSIDWTTQTGDAAPPATLSAWFPTPGGE